MANPPNRSIFKTPGISDAAWKHIEDECSYEAAKATASADPRSAPYVARARLFRMCAELKGAQYVGEVTMPDSRLDPIWDFCKNEAKASVAGHPASQSRNQLQEDLAIDCLRREGVAFH